MIEIFLRKRKRAGTQMINCIMSIINGAQMIWKPVGM